MMPLSPMEPMEFREVCRWNNNGNSDDVFSGESKGTKEGDDGGVESVADEGAIHQPKQPRRHLLNNAFTQQPTHALDRRRANHH